MKTTDWKTLFLKNQLIRYILISKLWSNSAIQNSYFFQNVPVACVPTGVKHLHHKALDFEIGVYFEANGHGTVLYSEKAQNVIKKSAEEGKTVASKKLKLFMDMTNQCVGDALSDMLLVESVLFARGWSVENWFKAYKVSCSLKVLLKRI